MECNHRGAASPSGTVAALADRYDLLPLCPEVAGGLPTPRDAAERVPDEHGERTRVLTVHGEDVTDAYRRGAEVAVTVARSRDVAAAVLKARSPSCGSAQVYDGSFTRLLVEGEGVTAAALRAAGYVVVSEEDVTADAMLPAGGPAPG
ncbi:MAG: purine-nucleoside phosphorylase [Acidimicrobiales bacterium]|nr:purine-nucleoside phosphorylase [Acidimicrobiales bacterium]